MSLTERRRPRTCHHYGRRDRDLEREARRVTESRLMEEEAVDREGQGGGRRKVARESNAYPFDPGIFARGLFLPPTRLTAASA